MEKHRKEGAVLHIHPVESEAAWQAARRIRTRVFIEEQGCPPAEEWDGYDATSRHLLGCVNGEPIATARWRAYPDPSGEEIVAKLERFAVLPAHRGNGYGRALVRRSINDARQAGFAICYLHAQEHVETFYADLGFKTEGSRFMEAGIPHVAMTRRERRKGKREKG